LAFLRYKVLSRNHPALFQRKRTMTYQELLTQIEEAKFRVSMAVENTARHQGSAVWRAYEAAPKAKLLELEAQLQMLHGFLPNWTAIPDPEHDALVRAWYGY
jgi:hypothetical protein